MSLSKQPSRCSCEVCGKTFARKSGMYEHLRNVHKKVPSIKLPRKVCPISECEADSLFSYADVRHHLVGHHTIKLEEEKLSFPSESDFQKWKVELERKETSSYVHGKGWTKLASEGKWAYLHCNRSGVFKSTAKGLRRMKSQGTNKIGVTCPSGLRVTVNKDLSTNVIFYKTHCGHICSNAHVNLQREDRTRIAELLKSGLSMKRVLDDIRDTVLEENGDQSRLCLVDHQDLKNIKRDFSRYLKERGHASEFVSGELQIDSMNAAKQDSPVLYSKTKGSEVKKTSLSSKLMQKVDLCRKIIGETQLSDEENNKIDKWLDMIIAMAESAKKRCGVEETHHSVCNPSEPANKNVDQERQFVSTKTKRKTKDDMSTIKKKTFHQQQNIIEGVFENTPSNSILNIHSGEDHMYW